MKELNDEIRFTKDDFKEVFALFSSPTTFEINQIYDSSNIHYFREINLLEEYELCKAKQDFAVDSLRAVLIFLHRHGYKLEKDGKMGNWQNILEEFID